MACISRALFAFGFGQWKAQAGDQRVKTEKGQDIYLSSFLPARPQSEGHCISFLKAFLQPFLGSPSSSYLASLEVAKASPCVQLQDAIPPLVRFLPSCPHFVNGPFIQLS